jgi:hypothetical protein
MRKTTLKEIRDWRLIQYLKWRLWLGDSPEQIMKRSMKRGYTREEVIKVLADHLDKK